MAAKKRVPFRAVFADPPEPPAPPPEPEPATPPTDLPPLGEPIGRKDFWGPYRLLFRKKSVTQYLREGEAKGGLHRTLGAASLMFLGIGAIIGTGIFVLTGVAARDHAGNMVWLSFVIAGIVAALAAISYAELASMIPVSGSAYVYSYAGIGEIIGWIIAWDLILEYAVGAMTVAQGWSANVDGLLQQGGIVIPQQWLNGPLQGGTIDLPAVLIVLAITALLVKGIQESAGVTNLLVFVKVGIIVLVVFLGFLAVRGISESQSPSFYVEPHATEGFSGVLTAAGLVFFAYIGFDALSTTAEETKNPKRDLPIGILGSLGVSTVLYVLAALAIVRMVPYASISADEPFGAAFEAAGLPWAAAIVRVGAVAGITSVLIVLLLSQPRIFFSMARDGLLPQFIARVHPRFRTPYVATIITGVIVAFVGGVLPISILVQVTNIGTLFAFMLVSVSVIILRETDPDAPRGYRVPGPSWLIPGLGALGSLVLIAFLSKLTLLVFVFWFGLGLVIYAAYGWRHSRVAEQEVPVFAPDPVKPEEPAS